MRFLILLLTFLALNCSDSNQSYKKQEDESMPPAAVGIGRGGNLWVNSDRTVHVFLVTGQSNAEGNPGGNTPPPVFDASIPLYTWFFGGHMSTILEPLAPVDGFGALELTLMPTLKATGTQVAVYKHARGGARINLWLTGQSVWTPLALRIPIVTALLQTAFPDRPIQWSIIWFQGEADAADNPPDGTIYALRLRTVLGQLRVPSLCGPNALAYIIALNPAFPLPAQGIASIRAAELDVSGDIGNRYVETLSVTPPNIHYNSPGQNTIGNPLTSAVVIPDL